MPNDNNNRNSKYFKRGPKKTISILFTLLYTHSVRHPGRTTQGWTTGCGTMVGLGLYESTLERRVQSEWLWE